MSGGNIIGPSNGAVLRTHKPDSFLAHKQDPTVYRAFSSSESRVSSNIVTVAEERVAKDPFSHLPPYQPPKIGLVSRFPGWAVPYAELMRLHRPAGYYAFLFPHLFGILIAAASLSPSPPRSTVVLRSAAVQAVANIFLRGAACTYNDALDGPFDRLVERCRHRPVARRAVSPTIAHLFAVLQTFIWILIQALAMPAEIWVSAGLLAAIMLLYPFTKRWTNYPQVVLGFSLSFGQTIGIGSIGCDVWAVDGKMKFGLLAFYLSNVVNAMIYDTIYAYQDIDDDLRAGIRSMAIACMGHTKQWLSFLCGTEIALLSVAGWNLGFNSAYWLFAVCGTAAVLIWMLITWKVEQPADCWKWFCWTIWLTGATICAGLYGEYVYMT